MTDWRGQGIWQIDFGRLKPPLPLSQGVEFQLGSRLAGGGMQWLFLSGPERFGGLVVCHTSLVLLTVHLFATFNFCILDVLPPSTLRALSGLLDKEGHMSHQEPCCKDRRSLCPFTLGCAVCSGERGGGVLEALKSGPKALLPCRYTRARL